MNHAEEATKIARETRFAVLGRAIADALRAGDPAQALIDEATLRRRQEQDSAAKEQRFAALARQIGDANRNGKDLGPLLARAAALRAAELGPAVTDESKAPQTHPNPSNAS